MSATSAATDATAIRLLRQRLGARLVTAGDDEFAVARQVWNAAVTRRPAVIARCADTDEVSLAVRAARDAGLPLSVRAGGHDWAGRALRDGGLVVDLTLMRGTHADTAARTVSVQGGATAADLLAATTPHGMATATGVVSSVGMAGLTTVGGYGGLIGRHGLALDNLLDADVVLADGATVTAGPDHDSELWWALRGGGGNFGVVTRLRYRLHALPVVLAGMLMFPFGEAAAVLSGYAEVVADAPDELTVMCGFLPGPDGRALPFVCPFWSGTDLAAGDRAVARLRALGHPIVDQVGPMPYPAALAMFDGNISDRNHYLLRSRWFPEMSADAVDALVAGAGAVTSPYSALIVNRFHGAAARIEPGATAFAMRSPHQVAEVIAVWPPGESPQRHRAWADSVVTALDPIALPGGYPNLLGPEEDDRARASYGANLDRLLAAKRAYDPGNVFASAVPALLEETALS
ncbi:FAD-binding oxidoreductase [Actinoplanes sp. NEAU-A12]|uniref:FAD-binding oxidoreductase n=1 Tax=Actinoplanes sandaracinus TaxID=3045177 RepID=A0ABT6WGN6_9ACTN|nr:FAD-binding oxidoreductase [Actinoplanes sandaracinus]MDI6098893.1 FAD-binding oxidoreductase [Actinoplanes sandaracinus]